MKKTLGTALIGTVAVLVLFTSCGVGQTGEAAEPLKQVDLRIYKVPGEIRETLRQVLERSLGGDSPVGRVSNGPTADTLLVVAPPRIHAGVAQLLEDLEASDAALVPSPITLTYWFVVGRPLERSPAGGKSYGVRGRPLDEIDVVLEQIAATEGPSEFRLLERIQTTSSGQDRTEARGRYAHIAQYATRTRDGVLAEVSLGVPANALESKVKLEAGQFLVLGQTGYAGRLGEVFPDAPSGTEASLYYVMTSDLGK